MQRPKQAAMAFQTWKTPTTPLVAHRHNPSLSDTFPSLTIPSKAFLAAVVVLPTSGGCPPVTSLHTPPPIRMGTRLGNTVTETCEPEGMNVW